MPASIEYGREDGMGAQEISWTKWNQFWEIVDHQDIWVGEKIIVFLAYTQGIPTSLTTTEWMAKMYPDVWLVTETWLWNIYWLNVETLLMLDRDIMMLRVYRSYSSKSMLHMYLTSCMRQDCFIGYSYDLFMII